MGHGAVAVLDGGLRAWIARGGELEAGDAPVREETIHRPNRRPASRDDGGNRTRFAPAARSCWSMRAPRNALPAPSSHRSRRRTRAGRGEPSDEPESGCRRPISPRRGAQTPLAGASRGPGCRERRGHVRLRRHRLSQFARLGGCRSHRRQALCRILERVDPRSTAAHRPRLASGHLHAVQICYGARDMNTPAKLLPVTSPGKSNSRSTCTRSKRGVRAIFRSTSWVTW